MTEDYSDDFATFGDRIASAREALGLTQLQLSPRPASLLVVLIPMLLPLLNVMLVLPYSKTPGFNQFGNCSYANRILLKMLIAVCSLLATTNIL